MPNLRKEVRLVLLRLHVSAAYHQIVHIQLCLTQIKSSGSQSGNVVLKGSELQRNLLGLFAETFQLLRHCLRCSYLIGFLSAVRHHVIHDLVQSLCLEIHSFHDLRVILLYVIVSVLVRACTRIFL